MPGTTLSRIYCLTALFALLLGGTRGITLAKEPSIIFEIEGARQPVAQYSDLPLGVGLDETIQAGAWFTPTSYAYLPLIAHAYITPRYPNDYYYVLDVQWALEKVEAPTAWGLSTGQGTLIAILDTGADLDHPDLVNKLHTDIDWDFVNDDAIADDDHGHGTHVSGIAVAETDNSEGVAGMGWEAMLLPLKILDANGDGNDADLVEAIRYAADNGAEVINMSLGGVGSCPTIVQQAVDYAYAKGIVLAAAAGNDLGNTEMYPANCEHVLGVAATTSTDTRASFSNYGNHVSVAAPGSGIYSTVQGGGYAGNSGTSMAAPHVSGLAALLLARYPSYTPDQIASAILDNAADLGDPGWDQYFGCGRINAADTLSVGAHSSSPVCLQGVGPWSASAATTTTSAPFVPGEVILSFQPDVTEEQVALRYGASAEYLPTIQAWRLRVPSGQEQAILSQLQADPSVAYADLNHLVSAQ